MTSTKLKNGFVSSTKPKNGVTVCKEFETLLRVSCINTKPLKKVPRCLTSLRDGKYVREKPIIFSDAEFNSVHDGLLQFNRTYFGENKKKYFL
jgi:hypothetical protein